MAIQWTDVKLDRSVPAGEFKPLWALVLEAVPDWKRLRLEADGEWTFLLDGTYAYSCGPDGAAGLSPASAVPILRNCPPGCLLGRFGGSSAEIGAATAQGGETGTTGGDGETETAPASTGSVAFPIGRDCLYKVPEGVFGPLFIGFNLVSRPVTIEKLTLTVKGANL